jgi:hypothetical protein
MATLTSLASAAAAAAAAAAAPHTGFVPYAGEGFTLLLPSKWNPSKEKDFPDVVLRSE